MRTWMPMTLLLGLTPLPVLGQGILGLDFTPGLVPIVEGVYVYEGPLHLAGETEVVRTNSLVVVTDEGVVVVDGQDSPEEGRRMIEAIEAVTSQPIRYLINASPHGDHINSNEVFAGVTIIAHEAAAEDIAAANERHRASGSSLRPTIPDITYRDRMTLRVGGIEMELLYFGPGHTRGDSVVWLPDLGIVFLSELYFNGVFASLSEGFAREHLRTLESAMELPAEWWIPGHGYVDGQTREQLRAGLDAYYANVKAIHDAVEQRIARGESLEQVLDGIDEDLEAFSDLLLYGYLKESAVTGTYRALAGRP